jgi:SlyX protein
MTRTAPASLVGDQLIELQTRLAFQDNTLGELNDVVIAQERRITQLERELTALKAQMKTMAPSLTAPASEETPPPHY